MMDDQRVSSMTEERLRATLAAAINETSGPGFRREFPDLETAVQHAVANIRAARNLLHEVKALLPKADLHETLLVRARRHALASEARERGAKLVAKLVRMYEDYQDFSFRRGEARPDLVSKLADLRAIAEALRFEPVEHDAARERQAINALHRRDLADEPA